MVSILKHIARVTVEITIIKGESLILMASLKISLALGIIWLIFDLRGFVITSMFFRELYNLCTR